MKNQIEKVTLRFNPARNNYEIDVTVNKDSKIFVSEHDICESQFHKFILEKIKANNKDLSSDAFRTSINEILMDRINKVHKVAFGREVSVEEYLAIPIDIDLPE